MALLLIGLNHKTTPIELRERLYLDAERLYPVLTRLNNRSALIQETAILSTCNRFEIYAVVRDARQAEQDIIQYMCNHYGIEDDALRPYLYIREGRGVVHHLLRVASGLDSMILGETQILGQVGTAIECATTVNTCGTLLHRLFEHSQHTGKRARTETMVSQNTTSVSHAAALLVKNRVQKDDPYILVIGAGEMAELAAQAAVDHDLTNIAIINRTLSHGEELAAKLGTRVYDWSELWGQMALADVVISATGAPHTIFFANDMENVLDNRTLVDELVMVDVAVPRDICSDVDELDTIAVYDIDDLQQVVDESLAARQAEVPKVLAIIAEEEERYWHWLNERNVVPVIKDLRQTVQQVVQSELTDAMNKLDHLSDDDRAVVQRLAHRIMNKVLHSPTINLRQQAANGDSEDYANIVRDLFNLSEALASQEEQVAVHA